MATVEEVIETLRSEKEHLAEERDSDIRDIDLMILPGGDRAKKKVRDRYCGRVEVVNYVLNFLEHEKEVVCPD